MGKVTLRCPSCERTMEVAKDKTDPKQTAAVETLCDKCDDGGGFPEVLYFDASGKQLECD